MKYLALVILTAFQYTTVLASEVPTATITCTRKVPGDVFIIGGTVQFNSGFEFYGPAMNKFVGKLSFGFADGTDNSVAYTTVQGNQVRRGRANEPDFWNFIAVSQKGELIQMTLRSEGFHEGFLFGDIQRQNGQHYSASCQIQMKVPASENNPRPPPVNGR